MQPPTLPQDSSTPRGEHPSRSYPHHITAPNVGDCTQLATSAHSQERIVTLRIVTLRMVEALRARGWVWERTLERPGDEPLVYMRRAVAL